MFSFQLVRPMKWKNPSDSSTQIFISKWQSLSFTPRACTNPICFSEPLQIPKLTLQPCSPPGSAWGVEQIWWVCSIPGGTWAGSKAHMSPSLSSPSNLLVFGTASAGMPRSSVVNQANDFGKPLCLTRAGCQERTGTIITPGWSRENQMTSERLHVYGVKIQEEFCSG